MGRFGVTEILLILVVALLLFGTSRIADIGKGLGEGIRNFKKGLRDDEDPDKLDAEKPAEKIDEKKPAEKIADKQAKSAQKVAAKNEGEDAA